MIHVYQWDDVLARLTLIHIPVRCRVEAQEAEDNEFKEEVRQGFV